MDNNEQEQLIHETDSPAPETGDSSPAPARNAILWLLGGAYLVYTGYGLIKGFVQHDASSSVGFFLIGIVFLLTGAVLVFFG